MTWTWNPSDKSAGITLSNGDLTATRNGASSYAGVRSIASLLLTGKHYFEYYIENHASNHILGIADGSVGLTYPGAAMDGFGYRSTGDKYPAGGAYGDSYTTGDVIGVAYDADNAKLWFSKNNVWQASGDPVAGTNAAFTGMTADTYYAMAGLYSTNDEVTVRFTTASQTYSPPTGFLVPGDPIIVLSVEGYVYEMGNPVIRQLFLHDRSDGALVDSTTSSGDGYYSMESTISGAHYIVCLDDDAGVDYNDLIVGPVYPVEV